MKPTPTSPALILFDGVCNVCNASVTFIIDRDPAGRFRFASLQSAVGQEVLRKTGRPAAGFDSVVLVENGRFYEKSDAALRIARHLRGWRWAWGFRFVPKFLRNLVYDLIARNRYRWFGRRTTCRVPTAAERERFVE